MSINEIEKPPIIVKYKKKGIEHKAHSTAWKIALADFMTTLMILFFVLWVVNITPADKKRALVSFFQGKYDPSSLVSAGGDTANKISESTERLYISLSTELSDIKHNIKINLSKGRVELNLQSNVLFASGMSNVTDQFKPLLVKLVKVLKGKNIFIDIYGYTDNQPLRKGHEAENNLNLSMMRAQSVADEIIKMGIPIEDIGVHGEGARFPVATNATEAGRAKNRRIVIYMSPKRESSTIDLIKK